MLLQSAVLFQLLYLLFLADTAAQHLRAFTNGIAHSFSVQKRDAQNFRLMATTVFPRAPN